MRTVIGICRLILFVLGGLFTILFQGTLLFFTRGRLALIYPRFYHDFNRRLLGIKVIVEGEIERGDNIVYLGNHLSYLDIPVIGGLLHGIFVAKKEVGEWPGFGLLGNMGQTIYISRAPQDAAKETTLLLNHLDKGLPLIIFPEGTSSDGTKILPFKSSFFQIFLNKNIKIQPFTISLLQADAKPATTQGVRDLYAWHGDMNLEPHLWSFVKSKGTVVKVKFQKPILTSSFNDRKLLCSAVYNDVAKGLDLSGRAE